METYFGHKTLQQPLEGAVVAVGNFDGVHRGHREIIERVIARANALDVPSVVYTFAPHPVKLLAPHRAPPLITSYANKRELLGDVGVDIVVEEPFDRDFAGYSPERFVTEVLHEALGTKEIFVGYDFTFGRGGKANAETLASLGASFGLKVHCLDPLSFDGIVASSSKVRELVSEGDVSRAAALLGRPLHISGTVASGEQRGRTMGFPTANLDTPQELLPANGVYACWADSDGTTLPAVVNIGVRPTFHQDETPTIEAHILDFQGDLYGTQLALSFQQRLRPERAFSSIDELREQIAKDVEQARAVLLATTSTPQPSQTTAQIT